MTENPITRAWRSALEYDGDEVIANLGLLDREAVVAAVRCTGCGRIEVMNGESGVAHELWSPVDGVKACGEWRRVLVVPLREDGAS